MDPPFARPAPLGRGPFRLRVGTLLRVDRFHCLFSGQGATGTSVPIGRPGTGSARVCRPWSGDSNAPAETRAEQDEGRNHGDQNELPLCHAFLLPPYHGYRPEAAGPSSWDFSLVRLPGFIRP